MVKYETIWDIFKHCVIIARIDKIYDPSPNRVTNNTLARDYNWQFLLYVATLRYYRPSTISSKGSKPQTNWVKGYCGFLISLKPLLTIGCYKTKVGGWQIVLSFWETFFFIQRQYVLYIQVVWLCVKITKEAGNHHQRKHSSPVLEYFVQQSFACSRPFFSFLVFSWIHTLKARYEGKKKQQSSSGLTRFFLQPLFSFPLPE